MEMNSDSGMQFFLSVEQYSNNLCLLFLAPVFKNGRDDSFAVILPIRDVQCLNSSQEFRECQCYRDYFGVQ